MPNATMNDDLSIVSGLFRVNHPINEINRAFVRLTCSIHRVVLRFKREDEEPFDKQHSLKLIIPGCFKV